MNCGFFKRGFSIATFGDFGDLGCLFDDPALGKSEVCLKLELEKLMVYWGGRYYSRPSLDRTRNE